MNNYVSYSGYRREYSKCFFFFLFLSYIKPHKSNEFFFFFSSIKSDKVCFFMELGFGKIFYENMYIESRGQRGVKTVINDNNSHVSTFHYFTLEKQKQFTRLKTRYDFT